MKIKKKVPSKVFVLRVVASEIPQWEVGKYVLSKEEWGQEYWIGQTDFFLTATSFYSSQAAKPFLRSLERRFPLAKFEMVTIGEIV